MKVLKRVNQTGGDSPPPETKQIQRGKPFFGERSGTRPGLVLQKKGGKRKYTESKSGGREGINTVKRGRGNVQAL